MGRRAVREHERTALAVSIGIAVVLAAIAASGGAASGDVRASGAAGRIVFFRWTGDTDAGDIWVMNADGTGQRQLTRGREAYPDPAWSRDGRRIAFGSYRGRRTPSIWVMNADGTGQRQVRPILGVDPSWSPDDRIAFSGMRVMHEDGSGLRRLTPKGGFEPAWSPDGSSIAFVRQVAKAETSYEIFTMRATGGDERRLTKNRVTDFSPAWSPDGRRLAVERGAYVWVLNADGSDPRRLARGSSPTWSPDGSAIAFVRDFTLWVMEADGRRQRRISPEPGRPRLSSGAHSAPAWSP